jgi:hypothetical protein
MSPTINRKFAALNLQKFAYSNLENFSTAGNPDISNEVLGDEAISRHKTSV